MKKEVRSIDSMQSKKINSNTTSLVSWQSPEFIDYKKDMKWYVGLITIGVALTILFYYVDNFLAIVVVVLAVIIILMNAKQKPKMRLYKLSKDGLKINDTFYPMNDFKSFFISYVEDTPNLHLERTKKFALPISIFLTDTEQEKVFDFIRIYLPENTKVKATTSDLFSKWFRF